MFRGIAILGQDDLALEALPADALVTIFNSPFLSVLDIGPTIRTENTLYHNSTFYRPAGPGPPITTLCSGTVSFDMTPIGHISSAPQDHGTTILAPMFNGTPNASYESLKFFRPRASPRSTPASTARSSLSLDIPSGEVEADALSSGEQSPIRGRTLLGGHARDNWCSWATSRRQTGLSSIDIGSGLLRRRLLSKDFTTEPEEFDNSVVESLPFERFRSSLSEELHRAATFDSSIDLTKFGGHRDTFAVVGLRRLRNSPSDLPNLFYETLLPYIDFKTYQALRLSCQAWSAAVTRARPVVLPSVCMLPAEILEKIYRYVIPEKKWEQKLDVVQKYLFLHCHW